MAIAEQTTATPHALQILTTEHWSLLSSRGYGYTESMGRVSTFIAALSGAVVALALVADADEAWDGTHRERSFGFSLWDSSGTHVV